MTVPEPANILTDITRLDISVGVDNATDGIRLGIDGEPFWRVWLTPQGEVRVGNGTAPPVALGGSGTSQPLDADLTAIAALTTTAFGRGLLTLADAAAIRTAAGLGSAATHPATDFELVGVAAALVDDLSGVTDADAARTKLGLGTAATHNTTDYDAAGAGAAAYAAAVAAAATDATTKANAKVADAINDATTTVAPSQNAVFDALALKAPLASPALTGHPTGVTEAAADNSTRLATTAYVDIAAVPGQAIATPVYTATEFDVGAVGTTVTDVTGASITVPACARSVDIIWVIPFIQATTGTALASAIVRGQFTITDSSNVAVNGAAGFWTASQDGLATSISPQGSLTLIATLPGPVSAGTYKGRVKLAAALPANWTNYKVNPGSGAALGHTMEAIAR